MLNRGKAVIEGVDRRMYLQRTQCEHYMARMYYYCGVKLAQCALSIAHCPVNTEIIPAMPNDVI